jgi:hypothetical protein
MVILADRCFRHAAVKQVPSSYPAAERFSLSAHFPPDISSTCLFLLGSLCNASLRQPTSAKQPLCITRCVAHLTATLHQTVRCLWLLARLIQRPDFALPFC